MYTDGIHLGKPLLELRSKIHSDTVIHVSMTTPTINCVRTGASNDRQSIHVSLS